jgi:hypothetical protein
MDALRLRADEISIVQQCETNEAAKDDAPGAASSSGMTLQILMQGSLPDRAGRTLRELGLYAFGGWVSFTFEGCVVGWGIFVGEGRRCPATAAVGPQPPPP